MDLKIDQRVSGSMETIGHTVRITGTIEEIDNNDNTVLIRKDNGGLTWVSKSSIRTITPYDNHKYDF